MLASGCTTGIQCCFCHYILREHCLGVVPAAEKLAPASRLEFQLAVSNVAGRTRRCTSASRWSGCCSSVLAAGGPRKANFEMLPQARMLARLLGACYWRKQTQCSCYALRWDGMRQKKPLMHVAGA